MATSKQEQIDIQESYKNGLMFEYFNIQLRNSLKLNNPLELIPFLSQIEHIPAFKAINLKQFCSKSQVILKLLTDFKKIQTNSIK